MINIVCERTLLIGYVEEAQNLKGAHVDQAVADLNLKPVGDGIEQHTGALGLEGNLLLRMASQLDEILQKLDMLEAKQAAHAGASAEPDDTPRIRQWLQSLRQNPLKSPAGAASPTRKEPFDELVDTALATHSLSETETNH